MLLIYPAYITYFMRIPDLNPRRMTLDCDYVCRLLGKDLNASGISELLRRMRFEAKPQGDSVSVMIPSYRADILHPIDLVEDVAIAHGYMDFEPEAPPLYSLGEPDGFEQYLEDIRGAALGLGLCEVMTLMLTSQNNNFSRMSMKAQPAISAKNPVSKEQAIVRTWLLPSLMKVLSDNRSREYPQNIFEIGKCISPEGTQTTRLAAAIAGGDCGFSQIKAIFSGIAKSADMDMKDTQFDHPSFISGRCAGSQDSFFGEIHPEVLNAFGIEVPVAAFEARLG